MYFACMLSLLGPNYLNMCFQYNQCSKDSITLLLRAWCCPRALCATRAITPCNRPWAANTGGPAASCPCRSRAKKQAHLRANALSQMDMEQNHGWNALGKIFIQNAAVCSMIIKIHIKPDLIVCHQTCLLHHELDFLWNNGPPPTEARPQAIHAFWEPRKCQLSAKALPWAWIWNKLVGEIMYF